MKSLESLNDKVVPQTWFTKSNIQSFVGRAKIHQAWSFWIKIIFMVLCVTPLTLRLISRDPLTGPPSHWSPLSLVPFSLVPQLIGPPIHYWSSLVPHLIGPPYHWSPIPLAPLFISHPIIGQSQWSPISSVPHLIGPISGPKGLVLSTPQILDPSM